MKHVILNCIFCLAFIISSNAQVDFQIQTLEEIGSDKPIFIDVYTTWCGPCKKMDRTTFQDSAVSAILNENFTCLKWDAEDDRFRELTKRFDVKAYPTLLFLNADRELINRPIGFLEAKELSKTAEKVLDYINNSPLNNVSISSLSLEESSELLSQLSWLEVPKKTQLIYHLIGLLGNSDSLWRSQSDIISLSAHNDLELEHVERLIYYHEPIQLFSNRSIETIAKIQMRLSTILEYRLKKAKKAANYQLYLKISHLKGELALASGQGRLPASNTKQLKTDRLDYYRYNNVKDHYKPLADSLIKEYILPHSAEKVLAADKTQSEYMARFFKSAKLNEEDEKLDSLSVEFYKKQHFTGLKIANRLDNIANGILALYEDKESIEDALKYSTLSYEYLKLPKYLVTKAKIQYKLGNEEKAIETLNEGISHLFYESERLNIEKLLKKYNRN